MNRRGITLIELLISVILTAAMVVTIGNLYSQAANYDGKVRADRSLDVKTQAIQDKITDWLRHAELAANATATDSYFIGNVGNVASVTTPTQVATPQTNGSTSSSGNGNSDTLIFTVTGLRLNSGTLTSDDDFETQNTNHGPQGGVAEVAIYTTPVGTPPQNQTGLFNRFQRPADIDPSQGGNETLMSPDVTSIQFEFWDGAQYEPTWDSRSMTPTKRLPAAVRVTYQMQNETNPRVFVVTLPNSDVTMLNPVVQGGATTTTTGR